jgi:hypothetical protein
MSDGAYFSAATVPLKCILIYSDHTPADERVGPSITGAEATCGSRPEINKFTTFFKEDYNGISGTTV